MPVWLEIIAANAVICLACYARATYKAYKSAESALEEAKHTITFLKNQLRIAYTEVEKLKYGSDKSKMQKRDHQSPDFLFADDPLEALLNEVGKAKT